MVGHNEEEDAGVKGSGDCGQGGADQESAQLVPRGADADRERRVLVFANRHQVVAELRARDHDRQRGRQRHQCDRRPVEAPVDVAVEERGYLHADIAARQPGQVFRGEPQDLGKCDGREREIRASQPERHAANQQRADQRRRDAHQHGQPRRHAELPGEQRQPVRSGAEVRRVPERKLARVSADQIPREAQRCEQVDAKQHLQRVVGLHNQRNQ